MGGRGENVGLGLPRRFVRSVLRVFPCDLVAAGAGAVPSLMCHRPAERRRRVRERSGVDLRTEKRPLRGQASQVRLHAWGGL
jgi:hypothetical protein